MSGTASTDWRGVRIWSSVAGVIALLLAAWCANLGWQVSHAHTMLPARHAEATPLIESVYRYHRQMGEWPDEATAARLGTLHADWTYSRNLDPGRPESGPVLSLYAPYHMGLTYYFAFSPDGQAARRWRKTWEGADGEFETDGTYRTE